MATTNINIRVDELLKKDAEALFNDLGLSMSSAITMFLKSALNHDGIPFEVKRAKPNTETIQALAEYETMKAHPEKYKRYSSFALKIVASNTFKKDLKSAKKRGLKLDKLQAIVDKLAAEIPLEQKHRDHALTGNYKDFRECHIEPDWLLIYRKDTDVLELFLFRTGTHADLF